MRPTLQREIRIGQATIVLFSCTLLAGATALGGGLLLRRDQDEMLRAVIASTCQAMSSESEREGLAFDSAAHEEMTETDFAGHRVEVLDEKGDVIAFEGSLAGAADGWPDLLEPGTCASTGSLRPWSAEPAWRACVQRCGSSHAIRVVGRDALSEPFARRGLLALVAALPVAAVGGSLLGGLLVRRRLRPLSHLRSAVARIDLDGRGSLGVRARAAELADLEGAIDDLVQQLRLALDREKRFAHEAAHELRTPLTALRARLELARDARSPAAAREDLDACIADVEALSRLTSSLLVLARSESAALPADIVNACDVARSVVARQRSVEPARGGAIEVHAPDEILVAGDEDLLATALATLVDNARRHGGKNARIVLRLGSEARHAVVTVSDDGPGIAPEQRELVFDRFFRGTGQRAGGAPGAGLGLAVARAIALRHGGSLTTGPSSEGGEEMRMELPLREEPI
jgi:signal transduction histidine kinase